MVPPIMLTRLFAMAMPSPVPCGWLAAAFDSRANTSNTCSAKSAVMPMPLSLTTNSKRAVSPVQGSSRRTESAIEPFDGVYLTALVSRFRRT